MKKSRIFKTLCLIFVLLTVLTLLSSCSQAPAAEEISARVDELLRGSQQINKIFFGEGLPTYPRNSTVYDMPLTYSEEHGVYYLEFEMQEGENACYSGKMIMYYDTDARDYKFLTVNGLDYSPTTAVEVEPVYTDEKTGDKYYSAAYKASRPEYNYTEDDGLANYDVVRTDSPFVSIDAIKEEAEKYYTESYLEAVYSSAFDGVAFSTDGGVSGVRGARFTEYEGMLRQRNDIEPYILKERVYDISTLKIIRPSNSERVNITIDSHLEGESEILKVNLVIVLGEDGKWYLDSPSY